MKFLKRFCKVCLEKKGFYLVFVQAQLITEKISYLILREYSFILYNTDFFSRFSIIIFFYLGEVQKRIKKWV